MARYNGRTSVDVRARCLGGAEGEIVVCARRQQNLKYRLPMPTTRLPGERNWASVSTERNTLVAPINARSESCPSTGYDGTARCFGLMTTRDLQQNAGRESGLVRRVLTYLDPDE